MPDEHDPETPPDTVPDSEESGTARPNIPQAILDALPEDIRTSVIQAALFSGPLPPPGMYREYEEVLPGSANRLMELTEDQQKHRHKWESDALDAPFGPRIWWPMPPSGQETAPNDRAIHSQDIQDPGRCQRGTRHGECLHRRQWQWKEQFAGSVGNSLRSRRRQGGRSVLACSRSPSRASRALQDGLSCQTRKRNTAAPLFWSTER